MSVFTEAWTLSLNHTHGSAWTLPLSDLLIFLTFVHIKFKYLQIVSMEVLILRTDNNFYIMADKC